jgi:hypothetical protein
LYTGKKVRGGKFTLDDADEKIHDSVASENL